MHRIIEPSPEAWDTFVKQQPRAHILQLAHWGQLKAAYGWRVARVALTEEDQIVAGAQILISLVCCVVSPLLLHAPPAVFLGFLLVWGVAVVGDSPQFSALNANTAPREFVGSALTIVTSIGFLITIPSIQLISWLSTVIGTDYLFLPLAIGPFLGLISMRRLLRDGAK